MTYQTQKLAEFLHNHQIPSNLSPQTIGQPIEDLQILEDQTLPITEKILPNHLILLTHPFPKDQWKQVYEISKKIETQKSIPLFRHIESPHIKALTVPPEIPLDHLIKTLELFFAPQDINGALISALAKNTSTHEIIQILGHHLDNIALYEPGQGLTQIASHSPSFTSRIRSLPTSELFGIYQHQKITLNGEIKAYLLCEKTKNSQTLLKAGAQAIAINLSKQENSPKNITDATKKETLLRTLILYPTTPTTLEKNHQKLLPPFPISALVIRTKTPPTEKQTKLIRESLNHTFPESISTTINDHIAAIIHSGHPLRPQLEELTSNLPPNSFISAGSASHHLLSFKTSYTEALNGLKLLKNQSATSHIIIWEEQSIYNLLLPLASTHEASQFIQTNLHPLDKHPELEQTLRTLIQTNWHGKKTAQKLSIHYNTLRYRLEKISQLTQSDLEDPNLRLSLTIAIKLKDLQQK